MTETDRDRLREHVRQRYAMAATAVSQAGGEALAALNPDTEEASADSSCCGDSCGDSCEEAGGCCGGTAEADDPFGAGLYDEDSRGELPAEAVAASLGCGNPTAVADLRPGETVLDLGSGGGIDVLLSARRVGPTGFAYGVDMTDEMLEVGDAIIAYEGLVNVVFLMVTIEDVALAYGSVVVVFWICVI
jgi:2-polyprenyl-3-methyl-5-hydroxy-6-metoxy-1,4-benzoquinol methylase